MAVEGVVSSQVSMDLWLCVGFGLAFAGFIFSQIWWIFGGTLIFVSPFMGAFVDDELEKRKESKEFWVD